MSKMYLGWIEVSDPSLYPPWFRGEKIKIVLPQIFPSPDNCKVLLSLKDKKNTYPLAVETPSGEVQFLFDTASCLEFILTEKYYDFPRSLPASKFLAYQTIPSRIRHLMFKKIARASSFFSRREKIFPKWPIDSSLEVFNHIINKLSKNTVGLKRIPWLYGKKIALTLTHDIESLEGQKIIPAVCQVEESLNLRSCCFFSTHTFPLDHGLVKTLKDAGHEIGSHEAYHDMQIAFLPEKERQDRLQKSFSVLEEYGVKGFRSPGLVRTENLMEDVAKIFKYDSSCPDTEWVPFMRRPGGCVSVFPFFYKKMPILPVTLPQDIILFLHGFSHKEMIDLWKDKINWLREVGGVAVILTHPEKHLGGNPVFLKHYRHLLEEILSFEDVWFTLPEKIIEHWIGG